MSAPAKKLDALDAPDEPYEEITVERRIRTLDASCPTRRTKVDERLLAIARGELEPDDPFGGLIPIYDDGPGNALEDGWVYVEPTSASAEEAVLSLAIPRARMKKSELFRLPMSARAGYLVAQIDGNRTVEQLVSLCELEELETLELLDELLRLGAIELA